jgi:tRNA dimethylallyltransferase
MQQLIVIEGPTASGKTYLGVELAKALNTVVISADSRQFYRELAIGTAKPSPEEMDGVPHYFVDSHSIHDPVTSARYEREALELLQGELAASEYVVVVGGSGMFIDALCVGLDPIPADAAMQNRLRGELELSGPEPLLAELQHKDPAYFNEVDRDNFPRVLRALEVIRLTGKPFSEWRKKTPPARPFTVRRFVIDHPRELLYDRINRRVDAMIAAGLLDEARSVAHLRELPPLQTVGYKECFDYFDGKTDLQTCIAGIKQHTRNYAKRQLTWFKRHPEAVWIPYETNAQMLQKILQAIDR